MSEAYADLRPLLFAIAYRMVGSVAEAEDVVQDAFVRYQRTLAAGDVEVESPRAYLSAVTTRLAIDHLRSARVRRERYVGAWLPEPLPTGGEAPGAGRLVEDADSLSMAFLAVLERLSPLERAVFLLRDVFDYRFAEIAGIVGRSEDACRQLAVRARRHVSEERPRFEASRAERDALAERFLDAVGDGDLDGLVELLAADATVISDNGGVRPAFQRPIVGRDRVARLLVGLRRSRPSERGDAAASRAQRRPRRGRPRARRRDHVRARARGRGGGRADRPRDHQPGQAGAPRTGRERAGAAARASCARRRRELTPQARRPRADPERRPRPCYVFRRRRPAPNLHPGAHAAGSAEAKGARVLGTPVDRLPFPAGAVVSVSRGARRLERDR